MKYIIITLFLSIGIIVCNCQTKQRATHHFDNEFGKYKNTVDYYNWKVFLIADDGFSKSIRQVEYYLDPSFKNPNRIMRYDERNPNFTLCCNGWGEFTLRIKIIFTDNKIAPLYETYKLDLHSPAKKSQKYTCQF
jgi:Transcription initiation factor IIF, auxiliary subunit